MRYFIVAVSFVLISLSNLAMAQAASQGPDEYIPPNLPPELQAICQPCYDQLDQCQSNCVLAYWNTPYSPQKKCDSYDPSTNPKLQSCYDEAARTKDSCLAGCQGYDYCEPYCNNNYALDRADCENRFMTTCYGACVADCRQKFEVCIKDRSCYNSTCRVRIDRDFDGVSADGISNITFKLALDGDYSDYEIKIPEAAGGQVIQKSKSEIMFIPSAAGAGRNYLTPQKLSVTGSCTPSDGGAKAETTESFYVVQPPLFFVHGILSSAETWRIDEARAAKDGWSYGDISYNNTGATQDNANQLGIELDAFLEGVRQGAYYGGKKISASKVDLLAHSLGGLVTRYYIGHFYDGNILRFIMVGTPNHGASDAYLTPIAPSIAGQAGRDLRPDSEIIRELNQTTLNPQIGYYTIAGTGWATRTIDFADTTWNGDGIVLVDSVRLPGVPLYCTYDAHSSQLYFYSPYDGNVDEHKKGKMGWFSSDGNTLTSSEDVYNIFKSIILTGSAQGWECDQYKQNSPAKVYIGTARSPVTLHAYDAQGNHLGPTANGTIENQLGQGAFYSNGTETTHQMVKIVTDREIKFVIVGERAGQFGLDVITLEKNGTLNRKSFDNVSVNKGTSYTYSPQKPEAGLVPSGGAGCPLPLAVGALFFGYIKHSKKRTSPSSRHH
jgi:pimeloyl-ACP methyl ester carboxylesterase